MSLFISTAADAGSSEHVVIVFVAKTQSVVVVIDVFVIEVSGAEVVISVGAAVV